MKTPEGMSGALGRGASYRKRGSRSKVLATNRLKNGLFHHVIESPLGAIHVISKHKDAAKPTLGHLSVRSTDIDSEGHGVWPLINYTIESKVAEEHRGKGYGKMLYAAALAHHGQLTTGGNILPAAHKVWKEMMSLPGIDQKNSKIAKLGTKAANHVRVGDKRALIQHLFQDG